MLFLEKCKWAGAGHGHRQILRPLQRRTVDFTVRYSMELNQSAFADGYAAHLLSLLSEKPVTLLYGAKDPVVNHAVVLKAWLEKWIEVNVAGGKR